MANIHFRPYTPNQTVFFPQRIDADIAADAPVRIVNAIVDSLDLDNFSRLYKATQNDAQGYSLCLHEQCLLLPQDRAIVVA